MEQWKPNGHRALFAGLGLASRRKATRDAQEEAGRLAVPIGRRALFAGLGLGALSLALPAPALAFPGVGGGSYAFGGGSHGGVFYKDRGIGHCNNWQADWRCSKTDGRYVQRLRLALGLELLCDYSNELYTHVIARPIMACGDDNTVNRKRLWYLGGNDNRGTIYLNNNPASRFEGDLLNTELGEGTGYNKNTGFKSYTYVEPTFWTRRAKSQVQQKYTASVDISNVYASRGQTMIWYEWPTVYTTLWLGVDLEQWHDRIYISNRADLHGLIVEIQDEQQRSQLVDVLGGTPAQGSQICLWQRYGAANQNWMVKPGATDELGGLMHVFAPMNSKGLSLCLNEYGAGGPSTVPSNAVQLHPYDGTRASEWWAHDFGGGVTYLFGDATGRLLDRTNGAHADGAILQSYSTGYCDQWDNLANRWRIEEVSFRGEIDLPEGGLGPDGSITCPDPRLLCTPRKYHEDVDEGLEYIYRWYAHPTEDGAPMGIGRVMGQGHVANLGDQAPAPAHGHLGYPHLGKAAAIQGREDYGLESFRLYLDGSMGEGGISYETDRGDSGSDGSWCGPKGVGHRFGGVRVWLTGEAARHFDLAYRVFRTGFGWSDAVYSSGPDDAPLAGGAWDGSGAVRGLWVMPVAKPVDGVAVSGFSTNPRFTVPAEGLGEIGTSPSYLSCAVMLSITGVPREEDRVWTDRYLGTVVSSSVGLLSKVHFMLNDVNGDAVELSCEALAMGTVIGPGDEYFARAYEQLGKLYEARVCELSDRWYEGDEYGAADWGERLTSKKVDGETWIWVWVKSFGIRFYSDGLDKENLIHQELRIPVGRKYTIPQEAYEKARKPDCNLDARFGTQEASGFTGWFRDKELAQPVEAAFTTDTPGIVPLYARNRATLRVAYAAGSAVPEDGADYRTAPADDAPRYARAMELPVFDDEPEHRLDGVALPATGDWADRHCLGYFGEVLTLPGHAPVYQRLGDGRWRTFRALGWAEDPDGAAGAGDAARASRSLTALGLAAGPSAARVQVDGDATRYVKWVEGTVDGVETSE